jgi:hypothetical protein
MSNVSQGRSSLSRMMLGVIPALLLGACTESGTPSSEEMVTVTARTINNQTGATQEHTATLSRSAWEGMMGLDSEADKVGCVHIRFCRTTFVTSNDVLCDTNDIISSTCTSNRRFSECNGDAQAVCGRTRPMGFDPAIPCPISGVPTVVCGSGESLVWVSN